MMVAQGEIAALIVVRGGTVCTRTVYLAVVISRTAPAEIANFWDLAGRTAVPLVHVQVEDAPTGEMAAVLTQSTLRLSQECTLFGSLYPLVLRRYLLASFVGCAAFAVREIAVTTIRLLDL